VALDLSLSPRGPTESIAVKSEERKCLLPSGIRLLTIPVVILAAMDSRVCSDSFRTKDQKTSNFHEISKSMHFQQDGALCGRGSHLRTGTLEAEGCLSLFFGGCAHYLHQHKWMLSLSCLLFSGLPVLIFRWRTDCCGPVGISVRVTTS